MKNEENGFCRLVFLHGIYGCFVRCVLFVTNLLKGVGKMEHVKGFKKLSPDMQRLFREIYAKHLTSMGTAEKEKHLPENMKEIKVNQKERCFEVYYKHDWYKYYPNGTWG